MKTYHQLINQNANDLKTISDNSVQLIVTSPPYPMIEMWDPVFSQQDRTIKDALSSNQGETAFEKMHCVLDQVWQECDRVLAHHGFICINIGDATRTVGGVFRLFPNHVRIISAFANIGGYYLLPDIHWRKPCNTPNKFMGSGMYPAGAYVTYEHEYILIFRKGGKRLFDKQRQVIRRESAYFWEERNTWFSDLWDVRGTTQQLPANTTRNRSGAFPFEIPFRLVNMYSIKHDTVLDPFCGLGTTLLACMASQRNSIGIEFDKSIFDIARETLLVSPTALNLIIDKRLQYHNAFIDSLSIDESKRCYYNNPHGFLVKTRQETDLSLHHVSAVNPVPHGIECIYQ